MADGKAPSNCAILYQPDAYSFRRKVMGRMAAGRGFLDAFLRHSGVDTFYCVTPRKADLSDFQARVREIGGRGTPVRWIMPSQLDGLREPGCLYRPDPDIGLEAWRRQLVGPAAYSLCGVNHTLCSQRIMDVLGGLLVAPVQPWDALVCTSEASRAVIVHVLGRWAEYLAWRCGGRPEMPARLPVIPLGVDCDAFERSARGGQARHEMRLRLGIAQDDLVVLYVGRISFHAKAHPLPMFLGLEEAARRVGRPVHLILAGVATSPRIRDDHVAAAQQFCPSVRIHLFDGRGPELQSAWHAADLFTSLVDNIQETFGLVPIEAMAAGLPQVVSDWDGYRDTVRHGVDGFRVATLMPAAGAGAALAQRYGLDEDGYDRYVGHASQCTAVDVGQCIEAYVRLLADGALRRKMGEAARRRARTCFDWAVIVGRYQELWRELAEERAKGRQDERAMASGPPHPLREDPFAVFSSYPTIAIGARTRLRLVPGRTADDLRGMLAVPMMAFARPIMGSEEECRLVLDRLRAGARLVEEILGEFPAARRRAVHRALGWMAKADLIRVEDLPEPRSEGDAAA